MNQVYIATPNYSSLITQTQRFIVFLVSSF